MNREDILAKSRQENRYQDEHDQYVTARAALSGASFMTVLFLVLCVIRHLLKEGPSFDLFTMYFGYWTVSSTYRYHFLHNLSDIPQILISAALTVVCLILYIWKG